MKTDQAQRILGLIFTAVPFYWLFGGILREGVAEGDVSLTIDAGLALFAAAGVLVFSYRQSR